MARFNPKFKKIYNVVANGNLTLYGVMTQYKSICETWAGQTWNNQTFDRYCQALVKFVLPHIKNYNSRSAVSFTRKEFETVIDILRAECKNGEITETNISDSEKAIKAICFTVDVLSLGPNVFEDVEKKESKKTNGVRVVKRLRRSLEIDEIVKFLEILLDYMFRNEDIIRDRHGHAIPIGAFAGVYTMLISGARDGEAAATLWGHIKTMKTHPDAHYLVLAQSADSRTGETKDGGKTSNAPREIPLGDTAIIPYHRLRRKIQDRIFMLNEENRPDIRVTPISMKIIEVDADPSSGKKRTKKMVVPCEVYELIRAANFLLEKIGIRREELNLLAKTLCEEQEMLQDQGLVGDTLVVTVNPTLYLLRRTYAGSLSILPGIGKTQIQYLMGHKLEDSLYKRKYFSHETELFKLYQAFNQYPLYNAKVLTAEDMHLYTVAEQEVHVKGSQKFVFTIDVSPGDVIHGHFEAICPMQVMTTEVEYHMEVGSVQEYYDETDLGDETMNNLLQPEVLKFVRESFRKAGLPDVYSKKIC